MSQQAKITDQPLENHRRYPAGARSQASWDDVAVPARTIAWMPPRGVRRRTARVLGLWPVRAGAPKRWRSQRGGTTAESGDGRRDQTLTGARSNGAGP